MKKILLLTLLSFGCTSASVLAKKVTRLWATCPTVAVIDSINPNSPPSLPPWNINYIKGDGPYRFDGAEIKVVKVGNIEEAQVTCKYRGFNQELNGTVTQFSFPVVEPRTCSFIINEHAVTCYGDPAKCSVYCTS